MREFNGTNGRLYGGDSQLIHVADGQRANAGRKMAAVLDELMRQLAENRTERERVEQALCPGCYMIVAFDMLLTLSDRNGQPRAELALSMIGAFQKLLEAPENGLIEEICIILDNDQE